MFKRIGLFLITNIAIVALLSLVFLILENIFGVTLSGYSYLFVFALVIGFGGAIISLLLSKWMAKKAYNITMINSSNYDKLDQKELVVWNTVKDLAERNYIEIPEVGIYKDIEPNAFATGASKNKSLVAVSTGLLESMDTDAIEGVIAHEMAHVLNGDMVTMTLLQGVVNTFVIFLARVIATIISNFLDEELSGLAYIGVVILLEIMLGIMASIIVMAFSRHREFRADAGSAEFVGKEKMIAGLKALKNMKNLALGSDSKLATMKISTKGKKGILSLFSSHPDLDDRIMALEKLNL